MTIAPKPKRTRKKKITIITTCVMIFGASWWIWNIFHPQQFNSPQDIDKCQRLKHDLVYLQVPHDAEYFDNLKFYNDNCAQLTGGV